MLVGFRLHEVLSLEPRASSLSTCGSQYHGECLILCYLSAWVGAIDDLRSRSFSK